MGQFIKSLYKEQREPLKASSHPEQPGDYLSHTLDQEEIETEYLQTQGHQPS